jgi:uroporphyrinogen-III synthase
MKRILITRPRAQADSFAGALKDAGFEPIYLPVIEIRPIEDNPELDEALQNLASYEWVIFTSVNGVKVVFDRLPDGQLPAGPRFAAIGPRTAEALTERGVTPDFVPPEYIAEAILPGLGDLDGKWVLLPRAEIARQVLPEEIAAGGGIAHEIAVYSTLPVDPDPQGMEALRSGVDVITLTSPSTVQNFVALSRRNGLDPLTLPGKPVYACIGPVTEAAAREEGLTGLLVAKEYTTKGLVEMIAGLGK